MSKQLHSPPSSLLPLRWALILALSVCAATIVGILTFANIESWPAALLAALTAAGTAAAALHHILGE